MVIVPAVPPKADLVAALRLPEVRQRMVDLGANPIGNSPAVATAGYAGSGRCPVDGLLSFEQLRCSGGRSHVALNHGKLAACYLSPHNGENQCATPRGVVLQDFLKGRPSEAPYLNGLVVSKGRKAKIPTPANQAIMRIVGQIERGELKPDRSNLALALQMIG